MFRIIAVLIALTLSFQSATAEECGGPDAACTAPGGGDYYIAMPGGAQNPPAVVFLHGYGDLASRQLRSKKIVKPMLDRGYAVIAPQGLPFRKGKKGGSWNAFASDTRRDDVDFIIRVAEDAAARFGIDRSRIMLAGFSGGGMMTWRVACDAPDSFAAFAPVAGLLWRPLPDLCAGPVRLFHTQGWSDPVVPIEGRTVGGGRLTQGDLFHGLELMREANECARDDPDGYSRTGIYLRRFWSDCAEGSALEMALHPGGHKIPKGWSAMALDWWEGLGG